MFFGRHHGGNTAAALRSFVASCQRASVDPFAWLKDVLSLIAAHPITRLTELYPTTGLRAGRCRGSEGIAAAFEDKQNNCAV
jgi:hypothetical protein